MGQRWRRLLTWRSTHRCDIRLEDNLDEVASAAGQKVEWASEIDVHWAPNVGTKDKQLAQRLSDGPNCRIVAGLSPHRTGADLRNGCGCGKRPTR